MLRYFLFAFLLLSIINLSHSQNVYIAPFKNDAAGAYTLIHDDFGASWATGIDQYADTMAYNRGIAFCFAIITKDCKETDWSRARELMAHGHQIINHSMSHICGKPVEWCQAGNWDEHDFDTEIDNSTSLIQKNTGVHPAFFVFPFDLFTDTMISYLRYKNYAGARAGVQYILQPSDVTDPFRLNFNVYTPGQHPIILNNFASEAAKQKKWAIRVVHGVNDGSWGALSLADYAGHLNYIKNLSDSNKVWVATLSDVSMYSFLKQTYSVEIGKKDAQGRATHINFKNTNSDKVNAASFKQTEATAKSKTITVVLRNQDLSVKKIHQKGKAVPFKTTTDKLLIDVDPRAGDLVLTY